MRSVRISRHIDWPKALVILWASLLIFWVPLAMVALMPVADSGTIDAYVFAVSILTYPLVVLIAAIFRRKTKWVVFAPCINVAATVLAYYAC